MDHENETEDEKEVARLLGKSVKTLQSWRGKGYGPRFLKIGHSVRYRRSDIEAWLEGCIVDPAARSGRAA